MTLRFGTVGSPIGTPKSGTPAAIAYARQIGLDALEIAWVRSVRISDESCAEIKAAAEQHDIRLSVHAPYYTNLNSQTANLMEKSDARLLAAARKGYLAGATDIIFHPGSYHDQPPEQVYQRIKGKLAEIVDILRAGGVTVTLRPETMGKSAMFGTLEEIVRLSREVDGVAPCIDVAHLHARPGDGSFNAYDEFVAMFRHVEQELGPGALRTMHFHLSGIEYGPKGEKHHVILEEADLNWHAFLKACVDCQVSGALVGESPNLETDVLALQQAYRAFVGPSTE